MKDGLKKKVISGLIWTYLERICAHLVSMVVSIVLARILDPKEYGIIAIVTIFTELSNVLIVNGTGTALVQKKETSTADFSTIFFFNLIGTTVLYFLLFLFAPLISSFYEMPELVPLLRVLGLQMPLAGIASIQQSYISKKMEFRKFFYSTIIGTIISALVGVALAYKGFGVWALVAQLMTNRIIDTTILLFTSGWKLTKEFSKASLVELLSYSWKITLSSFLITLWDNVRSLIIGKKYSPDDLAYYDKGRQFPHFISSNINTSISKVLFPALSGVQNEIQSVLGMTRRAIKTSSFLLFPLLFGLAACSKSFVMILLTEKWMFAVPYLQIMCVIYALQPLQTASIQAMKAIGRSDIYLYLEIVKKVFNFSILLISIFCFNDAYAIAVGALISEIVSTVANFPANKKLLGYQYKQQLGDISLPLVIVILMYAVLFFIEQIIGTGLLTLVVQVFVGGALYFLLAILFRVDSLFYVLDTIKGILKREA